MLISRQLQSFQEAPPVTQQRLRRVIPLVVIALVVGAALVRFGLSSGPVAGQAPPAASPENFGTWVSIGPSLMTPNNWAGRVSAVAVDPSVIPLGPRMTIPGYGEAIAADVGGAVHGNTIDLWFSSRAEAMAWGRRTVTITLH